MSKSFVKTEGKIVLDDGRIFELKQYATITSATNWEPEEVYESDPEYYINGERIWGKLPSDITEEEIQRLHNSAEHSDYDPRDDEDDEPFDVDF